MNLESTLKSDLKKVDFVDFFQRLQSTTMGEIWGRHIFWIWEKDPKG
jgi:hypothetical protein